jgi:hypothetical protein
MFFSYDAPAWPDQNSDGHTVLCARTLQPDFINFK